MIDLSGIFNWQRLDARITTSGQPSAAELGQIAGIGVTNVINLALHSHEKALPDEAATVTGLGMAYTHIPVDFGHPTEADYQRFCAAMAATDAAPVHVHCIANLRVTAFLYRYHAGVPHRRAGDAGAIMARALMESVWRPGGVWAAFIGDADNAARPHRFAHQDY